MINIIQTKHLAEILTQIDVRYDINDMTSRMMYKSI